MKIVLAGAFGNLGREILRSLCEKESYEVVAADLKELELPSLKGKYTFVSIDATNPETLKGLCAGADIVLTTMGLTGSSTRFTNYDIDYQGTSDRQLPVDVKVAYKLNDRPVTAKDLDGATGIYLVNGSAPRFTWYNSAKDAYVRAAFAF